ncbi:protein LURP-one-related 4 [Hibiscus syriacus]|uniref:Protein LURP-one-related 4 n=1 Tax=Hibiscus syriacus TaxID=106335 RepID=A0A6A3BBB1_HIBSY|nr:O-glucosyltransferase rumi homolog [Hibiscus syriacus]KAE8712875.1 protein LURP-one-related 4 [Hibiscus syriacus]
MLRGSGLARQFFEKPPWRPPLKRKTPTTAALLVLSVVLMTALITYSSWIDTSVVFIENSNDKNNTMVVSKKPKTPVPIQRIEIPLNCTASKNQTQTCPTDYPKTFQTQDIDPSLNPVCPDYFRWIHEDLRPWKTSGITRDTVERAKGSATFHLVIKGSKVYVKNYRPAIQTRDVFTIWGIQQLLRKYPGGLPDLEIMFDTEDRPAIRSRDYRGPNATAPPPLFRYCGDKKTLDIVFPDWSFWGWAEINIKPWESILKDVKHGNNKIKWTDREPYAYWKGNPFVDVNRQDLLKCNVTDQQDWNARLFIQDWILEGQQGFKQSNVADQCTYRYKIYIEGYAWSVSEKYILACDSVTLMVQPQFYDFFMRSMQPVDHYWPVRNDDKCRSLKFAVDWGNNHKKKAQEIGKAASSFMQEQLKMDYVYDYMFHLLNEYAKLLKFEPIIPQGATELCSEVIACHAEGLQGRKKKFMMESLVKGPSITNPCTLPPPYDPRALAAFLRRKNNSILQVKKWETGYWESLNKQ